MQASYTEGRDLSLNPQPNTFILVCPDCGLQVTEKHGEPDDAGTQFYRCPNGHVRAPLEKEITLDNKFAIDFFKTFDEFMGKVKVLALNPEIDKIFLKDIHRTVVEHDDHVIKANFYTELSTYNVSVNNTIKAESGAGKTYVALETTDYFPLEDVIVIGSQSPKVISHEHGELMTGKDEPLNQEDAPQKPLRRDFETSDDFEAARREYNREKQVWDQKIKDSYYLIRLTNKILVFLETISYEAFEMFKTTLSHDDPFKSKRISHKWVDDKGNVHHTVIEGYPSTVFCSTDKKFVAEFSTRTFTVSPSTEKAKIHAANQITSRKKAFPWEFEKDTETKVLLKQLICEIRDTFKKLELKTVNPFPNIEELFVETATRDMRDYAHFQEILPAFTMFKMFQRPIVTVNGQTYLVIALEDVKAAKALFDEIAETTKSGAEKAVINFYNDFVKTKTSATLDVLVGEYNRANLKNTLSDYRIRWYLKRLNQIGWVQIKKGEVTGDKRKDTFYPLKDIDPQYEQNKINDESSVISKTQLDLGAKLKNSFKTWLKTISEKTPSPQYAIIEFQSREITPLTVEEFTEKIIGGDNDFSLIVSETDTESKSENKAKSSGVSETQPHPQICKDRYCSQEPESSAYNEVKPKLNPEVFRDRFCGSDCGNYGKSGCPMFIHKIPKENPMPLKCYGWVAPLPTDEGES